MRWASALSEQHDLAPALREACDGVESLVPEPDLLLAFVSGHKDASIAKALADRFPRAKIIGCSAGGVIGNGHEVEGKPGISLTAASMPGAHIETFHATNDAAWRSGLGVTPEDAGCFLIFPDPFSCDSDELVRALDGDFPATPKLGGVASGGSAPGETMLFLDGVTHSRGAVGVAITGDVEVDSIVAQGCRPIGRAHIVTRADDGIIQELDKQSPADALRELFDSLDEADRALFRRSLFAGIERKGGGSVRFRSDDLLVRNIIGVEPKSGALAIGARAEPWQVLQFVVRDAKAAEEDLRAHLARYVAKGKSKPEGALMFSCLGRGAGLFGRADHDPDLVREHLGEIPMGGFFCNGEIGPVGGSTFLHGYTSAFALFRKKSDAT